jgi:predicted DsbA family dithiol-disulfide isomerase
MSVSAKPQLLVTLFTDYICPFCFIGDLRLEKLRKEFDLRVNFRFVEIHPDNPVEGRPVEELGYPKEEWDYMIGELGEMASEEGVVLKGQSFTTNSHKALLLAEAAKQEGRDIFYRLNRRIFEAYFIEGENIGDPDLLRHLAREACVAEDTVELAWSDMKYEKVLKQNLAAAYELGLTGTPAFLIGHRKLVGALPTSILLQAGHEAAKIKQKNSLASQNIQPEK